jgi:hypothetical protein
LVISSRWSPPLSLNSGSFSVSGKFVACMAQLTTPITAVVPMHTLRVGV